jgi:hypothetical protein
VSANSNQFGIREEEGAAELIGTTSFGFAELEECVSSSSSSGRFLFSPACSSFKWAEGREVPESEALEPQPSSVSVFSCLVVTSGVSPSVSAGELEISPPSGKGGREETKVWFCLKQENTTNNQKFQNSMRSIKVRCFAIKSKELTEGGG